jgi:hypothetical protein
VIYISLSVLSCNSPAQDPPPTSFTNMDRRGLYHVRPPALQTTKDMKPTLLVSWWCTGFALAIILVRVSGRYIRTEKLFKEDKIMAASIIPLMIRMALVHVILLWGTNNTATELLSTLDVQHREIGSRLVLASRIFYAAFIWTAKLTVLEFLKRIVGAYWRKSFEVGLQIIRYFLLATFITVVIATLTECQPFGHYWQVIPDPGAQCREGVAQLVTMGICDVITDLLVVIYPIPIVIMSAMPVKRKISLILLFALSLALVAVTAYRVPSTIRRGSAQQYRSLLASLEILAAAGVSNSIVIGSFIRDRGAKKAKYRTGSVGGGGSTERTMTRRTTITQHHWGSDSDLVGDLGMCLAPELQSRKSSVPSVPASVVAPPNESFAEKGKISRQRTDDDLSSISTDSTDLKAETSHAEKTPEGAPQLTLKRMSFFDVGNLIQNDERSSSNPSPKSPPNPSHHSSSHNLDQPPTSKQPPPPPPARDHNPSLTVADVGDLLSTSPNRSTTLPPAARNSTPKPPPPNTTDQYPPSRSRTPSHSRNFSRGSSAYSHQDRDRSTSHSPPRPPPPTYRPPQRRDPLESRQSKVTSTRDSPRSRKSNGMAKGADSRDSSVTRPWNGAGAAGAMDFVDAGGLLK